MSYFMATKKTGVVKLDWSELDESMDVLHPIDFIADLRWLNDDEIIYTFIDPMKDEELYDELVTEYGVQ